MSEENEQNLDEEGNIFQYDVLPIGSGKTVVIIPETEAALSKHNVTDSLISKMKEDYTGLSISSMEDKEGYKKVRAARLHCKEIISLAKKVCKAGRDPHISAQKAWINKEQDIVNVLSRIQTPLLEQEEAYDKEQEKIKAEKKKAEDAILATRMAELMGAGMIFNGTGYALGLHEISLEDIKATSGEGFSNFLTNVKAFKNAVDTEAANKRAEEEAAAAKEKAEQEAKEAAIKAEEEAKIAAEKAEKEVAEAKARAEEEVKHREEKVAKDKEVAEAKEVAEKAAVENKKLSEEKEKAEKEAAELKSALLHKEQKESEEKIAKMQLRKQRLLDIGYVYEPSHSDGRPERLSFKDGMAPLAKIEAATDEQYELAFAGCKAKVDVFNEAEKLRIAEEKRIALEKLNEETGKENEAEAARKEALKPDVEKLGDWLEDIRLVKTPRLDHNWAKAIASGVTSKIEAVIDELTEFINKNKTV